MSLNRGYSLDDFTDDDVDRMDVGGMIQVPGWYLCKILDIEDKTDSIWIKTEVMAGAFKGSKITVFLPDPDQAKVGKEKKAVQRFYAYAERLGLVTKQQLKDARASGQTPVPDWISAIDKVTWIELTSQLKTEGKYKGLVRVEPDYIPFYPFDDSRVPEHARSGVSHTVSAATAATPTSTTSDDPTKKTTQPATAAQPAASKWADL